MKIFSLFAVLFFAFPAFALAQEVEEFPPGAHTAVCKIEASDLISQKPEVQRQTLQTIANVSKNTQADPEAIGRVKVQFPFDHTCERVE